MKKINLLILVLIVICMVAGCSDKNAISGASNAGVNETRDNKSDLKSETETVNTKSEENNNIEVKQIQEDTEENETMEEDTSTFDVLSDVYETANISIGDIKITYPISWDDLKKILDEHKVDYSSLEHDISVSSIQANKKVYLDDDEINGNGFIIFLKIDGEKITVEQIRVNIANGIDLEKYPVKFAEKIDIDSDIEDVIKLYGDPDIISEQSPQKFYRWEKSDKRKVEVTISTGLGVDKNEISQIIIGSGN